VAILGALLGFAVALAGAGLAWLALKVSTVVAGTIVAGFVILGAVFYAVGRAELYRGTPKAASSVTWLQRAVLAPFAVAAAVQAIAVYLAIDRTTDSTPENKAIITAIVTAATTYLTTAFVDWTKSPDSSMVSGYVKNAFIARFSGKFAQGSDSQFAVQDDRRCAAGAPSRPGSPQTTPPRSAAGAPHRRTPWPARARRRSARRRPPARRFANELASRARISHRTQS
jgi:hypothetical protein